MYTRISILFLALAAFAISSFATTHNVTVSNFSFSPRNITVSQGDTVVWTCTSGTHNVHQTSTPSLFNSGSPAPAPWTFTWHVGTTEANQYAYQCDLHASMGMTGSVTVTAANAVDEHSPLAQGFSLQQNYPNPFNSQTNIEFVLPASGKIDLTVYNVLGEKVRSLYSGEMNAGSHIFTFDASDLTTGLYTYQLKTPAGTLTKTMLYVR
jgi:plastocyanin